MPSKNDENDNSLFSSLESLQGKLKALAAVIAATGAVIIAINGVWDSLYSKSRQNSEINGPANKGGPLAKTSITVSSANTKAIGNYVWLLDTGNPTTYEGATSYCNVQNTEEKVWRVPEERELIQLATLSADNFPFKDDVITVWLRDAEAESVAHICAGPVVGAPVESRGDSICDDNQYISKIFDVNKRAAVNVRSSDLYPQHTVICVSDS